MGIDKPILDLSQLAQTTLGAAAARATTGLKPGMSAAQARQAAEDFEAVFLSQMLAPMFEGLETDDVFGAGPGEDIYRSMLVEEYGKSLARAGGFGLADAVQREILRLQEVADQ
jgi:Rod binding domain-containing protein